MASDVLSLESATVAAAVVVAVVALMPELVPLSKPIITEIHCSKMFQLL